MKIEALPPQPVDYCRNFHLLDEDLKGILFATVNH